MAEAARLYHIMYPKSNFYTLTPERQLFYIQAVKEFLTTRGN